MSASFAKSTLKTRAAKGAKAATDTDWSLGWVTHPPAATRTADPARRDAPKLPPGPAPAQPARPRSSGSNPKNRS
jgi:hypothetical protein